MKTNFFENIAGLQMPGIWKMVIQSDEKGNFTVSELFTALQCGDSAAHAINPMVLNGTAQELDDQFFDLISQPATQAAGLYNNMEAHLKSVGEAKLQSKMELDAKTKLAKEKKDAQGTGGDNVEVPKINREERKKAYDEAMKKVTELSNGCKYADALAVLPSVEDYPEKKAELEKKTEDLNRMKTQYERQLFTFNQQGE